jgi:hypothetical protein
MKIFGNATQSYKGIHAQPATGGLSGLLGGLFGGTAPSYKSVDGRRVNAAQPSAGWWQALSKAPSYKAAPRQPVAQAQEVMPICDAPFADNGDVGAEQTCVCAPADATQIVILDE